MRCAAYAHPHPLRAARSERLVLLNRPRSAQVDAVAGHAVWRSSISEASEEDANGAAALTVRKEGHPVRPLLARGGARRVPITVSATVKAAQTVWPPPFHSKGSVHHFDMSELKLNAVLKESVSLRCGRSMSHTSTATGTVKSEPDAAITSIWPV